MLCLPFVEKTEKGQRQPLDLLSFRKHLENET